MYCRFLLCNFNRNSNVSVLVKPSLNFIKFKQEYKDEETGMMTLLDDFYDFSVRMHLKEQSDVNIVICCTGCIKYFHLAKKC
jgi:hypothetical protein